MHEAGFFEQALMYLLAAVVAVPLAKRWGLGSVLGYLIAGVAIGPAGLALVGEEGQGVMHFAEFGVVMMLFVVGLELEPSLLWRLRGLVLGLGGGQVVLTSAVLAPLAWLLGMPWQVALAVSMILALSSTAIVLQTLNEKGLSKTPAGQSAFCVLLFQDIAVIPMLALLPLLATFESAPLQGHGANWLDGLPAIARAAVVLVSMVGVVIAGRYLMTPVFRYIARARLRETFTATVLLLVIAIALFMTSLGMSPALGTFVAGVVLATSEYRHELEAEIEPFKGLLLGLFFIAVGASIDFDLIVAQPLRILFLVGGLVLIKMLVLFLLGKMFGFSLDQNALFSVALAQGGEFAFVLLSFSTAHGIVPAQTAAPLVAAVAVSMALTPPLMMLHERLLAPRLMPSPAPQRAPDAVEEDNPVIIAGYGRFGQIVGRLLSTAGYACTLLEFDADQVQMVRKFGARAYFGDATRMDLLHAAGAEKAEIIVLALDNPEKTLTLAYSVKKHFPHLTVFARARSREDAFDLHDAGVTHIYRELFDSSLMAGREVLKELGVHPYRAHRMARAFRRHDERFLRETAAQRHQEDWPVFVRSRVAQLERVLTSELDTEFTGDAAWDLREATAKEPSSSEDG